MSRPSPLSASCPTCGVGPGQRCRAMNQTAYLKTRTKPHPERRPPASDSMETALAKMRAARPEKYQRDVPLSAGHGTSPRYQAGCRCEPCVDAQRAYARSLRDRHRGTLPPNDPRHGTTTGYNSYSCRCEPCRQAMRDYHRALIQRNRAAAGAAS